MRCKYSHFFRIRQMIIEKNDTTVQKDKIRGFTQIIRSIRDKNNIFTLSNYHTSIV